MREARYVLQNAVTQMGAWVGANESGISGWETEGSVGGESEMDGGVGCHHLLSLSPGHPPSPLHLLAATSLILKTSLFICSCKKKTLLTTQV